MHIPRLLRLHASTSPSRLPLSLAHSRRLGGVAALALAVAACNSDDSNSPSTPKSIAKVSGDSQSVVVGASIAQPMVVRVLAQNGDPLANATVTWTLASGASGTLPATTSLTDANGRASMGFTGGIVAGSAAISATADPLVQVITFTQKVVAGPAAALLKASGDGAAGLVNAGVQVVAKVADVNGNAVSGVTVNFAIGASGGTLSATSAVSDAAGLARVTLTLGATPGIYTVTATSGTLPAITFSVTAI
jgi:Bacterial Ig-like domain (group 1)